MRKRKTYTERYKTNAVKMILEEGKSVLEVSRELDISSNTLHNWKRKSSRGAISSTSVTDNISKEAYIKKLEQENKRLKEERDILKKATMFFANEP